MNARRFPRTLSEAFGPYTDSLIAETTPKQINEWKRWREAHAKPMTAEQYQRDQLAEHASMQIERTR